MIKPNLPDSNVSKVVVSSLITQKMLFTLNNMGIQTIKLYGMMNFDIAVRHHPDMYITHLYNNKIFRIKNACSFGGGSDIEFCDIDFPYNCENGEIVKYPFDVPMNSVSLGDNLICCKKYIHKEIYDYATLLNFNVINVNQGYSKCNMCIVDKNSVITEDIGIFNCLTKNGFDVLLLQKNCVKLEGYKYGFIGGASGKIAPYKIAFMGDISLHPEYDRIKRFLYKRDIEPISLSDEPLTDFGSLLPIS